MLDLMVKCELHAQKSVSLFTMQISEPEPCPNIQEAAVMVLSRKIPRFFPPSQYKAVPHIQ